MLRTDYLTVTTPLGGRGVVAPGAIREVLDACGIGLEFEKPEVVQYRCGSGVYRLSSRGQVLIQSASGAVLDHFRLNDQLGALLMAYSAEGAHRVTRVDCALDLRVDAMPFVDALSARARQGRMALSRKAIAREDVRDYREPALYAPIQAGGSYFGNKKSAEVFLLAYDKRQEQMTRGLDDPGPWLRLELRVRSGVGPSLRDAFDPSPLFWHFIAPDVLTAPSGVAPWVSHAEGFSVPRRPDVTPMEKLFRLMEFSPDVQRLVQLIREAGPGAVPLVANRLQRYAFPPTPSGGPVQGPSTPGASALSGASSKAPVTPRGAPGLH